MTSTSNGKYSITRSLLTKEKEEQVVGFINRWGESNCFLNAALQVLFHFESFRKNIKSWTQCSGKPKHFCIACGLKNLFDEYERVRKTYSKAPIDISLLRKELASEFQTSNQFEINSPADSMEALNSILLFIHKAQLKENRDTSNEICNPRCPAHFSFELVVEERQNCICGSECLSKWDFSTFFHHVYINEIFEEPTESASETFLLLNEEEEEACMEFSSVIKTENRLPEFIRSLWQGVKSPICSAECKSPSSTKQLTLISCPKVLILSLIWKDFRPNLLKILQVFSSIPYTISVDSMFIYSSAVTHKLTAMILYGSGHYICAIQTSQAGWTKIDDESSKVIGKGSWKDLIDDLVKSHYYPVGLFYEETEKTEVFDIPANEWMKLERLVLKGISLAKQENNEGEWQCECGEKNNYFWKVCRKCNKIRSDVKGWACTQCTFINETMQYTCEACGSYRSTARSYKNQFTECPRCGKLKKDADDLCACSKTCRICGEPGSCTKCFSGYECRVCKDWIQKSDLYYCYKCKNKNENIRCSHCSRPSGARDLVCGSCLNQLWQCRRCLIFNLPTNENCEGTTCFGKKIDREIHDSNKQQRESVRTGCSGCGVQQKTFAKFCLNCKAKSVFSTCKFCQVNCRSDLCENCFQVTKSCSSCKKEYFFLDADCPYC